jgi:uncharacterized protein (TIGR00299 family) protein
MKTAYLDCFSGISGDMFLGALIDAGLSFDELNRKLRTLPVDGYRLEIRKEARNLIFGTRFLVIPEKKEQPHRNLRAIRGIIDQGGFNNSIKKKSIEIFEDLAKVEGNVHNLSPEEVHFHEIGGVDSIIDIVGTVYAIETMGIQTLSASPLPLGSGFVKTAHGRIPVPSPATIALLKGIPVFDSGLRHEIVTPTGAALAKGLASSFGPIPPMVIKNVGYGTGKKKLHDRPNLLRILIGHQQTEDQTDTVVILETNIDDTNPEWLGYLMDRLFNAGALDVVFLPVQMKKNRPGIQVQVMGRPEQKDILMEIMFLESTTIGIRFRYGQRKVLESCVTEIESPWGKIKVKKVTNKDGEAFLLPEYEECRKVALENNLPLKEIFYWVMALNKSK